MSVIPYPASTLYTRYIHEYIVSFIIQYYIYSTCAHIIYIKGTVRDGAEFKNKLMGHGLLFYLRRT
jgi:hypothetical protein